MKLRGVHHVSLNVRDIAQATAFYTDVLGLELLPRPDLGFPGTWLGTGDQQIHLIEVDGHQAPEGQHFAFRVEGIERVVQELVERGVKVSRVIPIPGGRGSQAFLRDPSGNLLELNESSGA
jgi:glyoxylase I family protein